MTMDMLRSKVLHYNSLCNTDLHVSHIYWRSEHPYTLMHGDQTVLRGTKQMIYDYLDAGITAINTYKASRNLH